MEEIHPRELSTKPFKWIDPMRVYTFEYCVYVLTGFWDLKSAPKWKTVLYKLYQSMVFLIYFSTLVLLVRDAVVVRNDLEKLSLNLSSTFLLIVTLGKVSLILKEKNNVEEVYSKLDNHLYIKWIGESMEDRDIFRKKARVLLSITMSFYALLIVGFPMRVIADAALGTFIIPIPYKGDRFELIYTPQAVVIFHFLVTVLSHDLLIYAILLRLIAHFEILEKNLLKIKKLYPRHNYGKYVKGFEDSNVQDEVNTAILIRKTNDTEKIHKFLENYSPCQLKEIRERRTYQLLKENIDHHQILLREVKRFAGLYGSPLFIQACGASTLIGIAILQLLLLSDRINILLVEQIIFVITLLCNVFFLCTFATDLQTKSKALAEALYDTPWYEMDTKNKRIVQFAIKGMLKGPQLKGGGLVVFNRVTYLKFLRISYNLIAVLKQMY